MKVSATLIRSLVVIGVLFNGTQAATPDRFPQAEAFAESILAGRIDLEEFDFEAAGYWKLEAHERLPWLASVQVKLFGTQASSDSCDLRDRRRFAAVMWLVLLQQSGDAATWQANYKALRGALRRHDDHIRAAGAGIQPAKDERARVTELRRREARDQAIRDFPRLQKMSAGLPDLAQKNWMGFSLIRMVSIDCDNTDWLAAQLREIGWFDIPTYGPGPDKNAWLLVQHADRNKVFQRETLAYLQRLPPGKTDPKNLALLGDRIAVGEGRPQRFGTQGTCNATGEWVPHEVEDPAGLESRRADLGLMPMADYIKSFDGLCSATK